LDLKDIETEGIYEMLYPTPVVLVTSIDKNGKPNALTIAWITPTSYDPPMVALSIRPERYSYGLIKESGEFVVNIPTVDLLKQVTTCGTISGRDIEKLKQANLTPLPARKVKPPILKECIAYLECKVVKEMETGDHILVVGSVVSAYAKQKAFLDKRYRIESIPLLLTLQDGPNLFTTPKRIISLEK